MKYRLIKSMTSDDFSWDDFNLEEFNHEFRHLTDSIMILNKESSVWKAFRVCSNFFEHISKAKDGPLTLQEHELSLYFENKVNFVSLIWASTKMFAYRREFESHWIEFAKCLYKFKNEILNINSKYFLKPKLKRYKKFNLKEVDGVSLFFKRLMIKMWVK